MLTRCAHEILGGAVRDRMAARIQRDPVPVVLSRDSLFTVSLMSEPQEGSALHPDGDRWILARPVGSADSDGATAEPDRLILVQNFFEELRQVVPE